MTAAGELNRAMTVLKEQLHESRSSSSLDDGSEEAVVPAQEEAAAGGLGRRLGLPSQAWPQLYSAVHETRDPDLIAQLEVGQG